MSTQINLAESRSELVQMLRGDRDKCKAQRDALLEVAKQALEQINPRLRAATLLRQAIESCEKV